jgi:pimeloyl-ACP methyl ester carboxylesterase
MPCVIYCHGNCGSRCDALDAVQILLPYNITVLAFDFSGSGLSEGDYVSLGFYEKQDLVNVVDYLWKTEKVSRIGLWGRSMGAATSIMYSQRDHTIAGIVVDSPFTSLEDVMTELVLSHQSWIPKKAIKMGINVMRKSILSRAQFDIRANTPIEHAKNCYVPALFAHAEGDDFIKIHHSERLFEVYSGDKNLIRFEGDHNSERPEFFYDSVAIFFYNVLISNDQDLEKVTGNNVHGSIATDMGIGIQTEKGKQIAREHGEDSLDEETDFFSLISTSSGKHHSRNNDSGKSDDFIGELPSSPHNDQVTLPRSLTEPRLMNATNEKLEQQLLFQALIESIRDEISQCKDDSELKELHSRMDEIRSQAKTEQIDLIF